MEHQEQRKRKMGWEKRDCVVVVETVNTVSSGIILCYYLVRREKGSRRERVKSRENGEEEVKGKIEKGKTKVEKCFLNLSMGNTFLLRQEELLLEDGVAM